MACNYDLNCNPEDRRAEIRRVLAATYHQVWWPGTSAVRFDGDQLPVWDEHTGSYLDPATDGTSHG